MNKGDLFRFENRFGSDPQVAGAIQVADRLLSKIGLKPVSGPGWEIVLEKGDLDAGAYRLEGKGKTFRIFAGDAEGTRCGIMALLQKLGVRWFDPERDPILPELPLALGDFVQENRPPFSYRGAHICSGTHHFDERVADWMHFNGMNRKLTHVHQIPTVGSELTKRGIMPDTTVHSYSDWVPDKQYFESNPKYFALLGGKRVQMKQGGQLCLSNKEMRKVFLANVQKYLDDHPEIAVIGICPNDGYGWCECEGCVALDSARDRETGKMNKRIAGFVEEICAGLEKSHPNVLVGHYSYSNFSDFHQYLTKTPDNLMVSCTTGRCYSHAVNDPQCPINAKIWQRLLEQKKSVKNVYIYDYYFHGWNGFPKPVWRVFEKDAHAYSSIGISGYMTETPGAGKGEWEGSHLAIYVMSRLLHDQGSNAEALVSDYAAARFGSAAPEMKGYLETLANSVEKMDRCFNHGDGNLEALLSSETRREALAWLKKAREKEPNPEVEREAASFANWDQLLEDRAIASRPLDIKVRPVAEAKLNGKPLRDDPTSLRFVERVRKVHPEKGNSWAQCYADDDWLAFMIDCDEEEMEGVADRPGNALGPVYGSDSIEIFVQDGKDPATLYHILVSISGGHCAAKSRGTQWDWTWNGGYQVDVRRFGDRWRVWFAVPRKEVAVGNEAAFTLIRNRRVGGWRIDGIPNGGAFFNPERYLKMKLP